MVLFLEDSLQEGGGLHQGNCDRSFQNITRSYDKTFHILIV